MRPLVAHIREQFLPLSQTFIHQFLVNMRSVRSVAVCAERLNADQFAWDDVHQIRYPGRYSPDRISTALLRASGLRKHANSMSPAYCEALCKLRPDVVHAHFGPEGVKVMDGCARLGLPLVVSFYGYDLSNLTQFPEWKSAYCTLFHTAELLVALSEDFRRRLIALGCPAEKIRVVRVGVDPDEYRYRDPDTHSDVVRFVGTARLVEKKGTRYTLEALATLRKRYPNIRYHHIGDGDPEQEVKELASRLGIQDICTFHGAMSRAESRQLMAESDVYVLPSVRAGNGDEEGTPVTIYEAMAIGMPVLSTRHSGIPEVVEDGVNGYLCEERDPAGLAANMEKLITDRGSWVGMARRGRERVETMFDARAEAVRLQGLYTQLGGSRAV